MSCSFNWGFHCPALSLGVPLSCSGFHCPACSFIGGSIVLLLHWGFHCVLGGSTVAALFDVCNLKDGLNVGEACASVASSAGFTISRKEGLEAPSLDGDAESCGVHLPPLQGGGEGGGGRGDRSCDNTRLPSISAKYIRGNHIASHSVTRQSMSANMEDHADTASTLFPTDTALCNVNAESTGSSTNTASHEANLQGDSAFSQLEQVDYSEDEDSDETDDVTTSSDDDKEEDEDEVTKIHKPNIPDLQSVKDLSWPTILQYVRDSQTMASQYFSLQNKEEVEKRSMEAKAMAEQTECSVSSPEERPDAAAGGSEGYMGDHMMAGSVAEDMDGSLACHFCGKILPRRSLLAESQDVESIKEKVPQLHHFFLVS